MNSTYSRINDPTSTHSSRAGSPAVTLSEDQYVYSTSIRRHDETISLPSTSSQSNLHHHSTLNHSGSQPSPTFYPPSSGPYHHHPFAHTATPLTPSSHYATTTVNLTLSTLGTSATNGLASSLVPAIRELAGPNEFEVPAKPPLWKRFAGQFYESPLILLLLGSAVVSAIVGNFDDAASIVAAIVIVVTGTFRSHLRAFASISKRN